MSRSTATGRYAFRALPCDIRNVETIAQALRTSGKSFPTRTDVILSLIHIFYGLSGKGYALPTRLGSVIRTVGDDALRLNHFRITSNRLPPLAPLDPGEKPGLYARLR